MAKISLNKYSRQDQGEGSGWTPCCSPRLRLSTVEFAATILSFTLEGISRGRADFQPVKSIVNVTTSWGVCTRFSYETKTNTLAIVSNSAGRRRRECGIQPKTQGYAKRKSPNTYAHWGRAKCGVTRDVKVFPTKAIHKRAGTESAKTKTSKQK